MAVTSNSDFAKQMMLLARPAEHFRPTATYDPDGDCIEGMMVAPPKFRIRDEDAGRVLLSERKCA